MHDGRERTPSARPANSTWERVPTAQAAAAGRPQPTAIALPRPLKPLARSGRLILGTLLGRELMFRREIAVPTEFHGTGYGGWAILADSLGPDSRVVSAGVGEDASFDLSLISKYGCRVDALDPTPKAVAWARATIHEPRFVLHERALSATDEPLRLFLPVQEEFVSASCRSGRHTSMRHVDVAAVTLNTLFAHIGAATVDVLKMDIEGAEYSVIPNGLASGAFDRVKQLLVEFHHFHPAFGVQATRDALAALRSAGWRIAWVSPSHHELLFIRP